MISYILWSLLLYFIYVAAPAVMRLKAVEGSFGDRLNAGLGARDSMPASGMVAARAARAQRNMEESLVFFLPLALMLLITGKTDGLASTGAVIYLLARAAYLPAYLTGVFGIRTVIWAASLIGVVMMAIPLHG